jgi:hypothetical protein
MSETICDLANELFKCKDWDPRTLQASVQADIPPQVCFNDDVPFATGQELIVDVDVNPRGYADVYIDDTMGLAINLQGTHNADRLEAAIPLAIKVAACPNDVNEPTPREAMVAQNKLKAEGGLAKTRVILGWHFNFRTLTVNLPKHKYIAWWGEIQSMLDCGRTTKKALESTIGRLGHVGLVIPWVFHFLSRLQTLLGGAQNRQTFALNDECKSDLILMLKLLEKAKGGIDMNLLGFCSPDIIWTHALPVWVATATKDLLGNSESPTTCNSGHRIICWNSWQRR